jgi:hypothetical protein
MTTRSHLLGLTAAAILVAPAAQGVSVKEIFEKYNLLGYWAVDCSKPASNSNLFYVNRILGTDAVQRDEMVDEGKRSSLAIIDAAIAVGPNEIMLNGTRDGKPVEATWWIEANRQRATEVTIDGQKVISNGRNVASGREVPWTNKCDAQSQPAQLGPPPAPVAPSDQPQQQAAAKSNPPASVTPPPAGTRPPPPATGLEAKAAITPLVRSVASGVESQVSYAWARDQNCNAVPLNVAVTRPPTNGEISIVSATVTAARRRVGTSSCPEDQQIAGKKIMYRSNPGFQGTDTVTYHVESKVGSWSDTITINVQ